MQENATRAHLEALALEKQRQELETARLAALALERQRQEQEAARLAALALEEQRQQQQERAAREQEAANKARYDLEAAQYMAQLERERWAAQASLDALEKEKATLLLADQAKAKQAETIKIAGAVVLVGLLILSRRR
jgi:lipid II:glycine glycyltransferase (peptidoglycan interpeptide bridge formation enzyme)